MTTTVRISWSRTYDNSKMWNEVCVWAIEMFGLPGDRFIATANVNYMDFVFTNKHDALIMGLKWNAPIVSGEEIDFEYQ